MPQATDGFKATGQQFLLNPGLRDQNVFLENLKLFHETDFLGSHVVTSVAFSFLRTSSD